MSSATWGQAWVALVLAWLGETYVARQRVGPATLSIYRGYTQIALSGMLRLQLTVTGENLEVKPLTSAMLEPSWKLIAGRTSEGSFGRTDFWSQEIKAEPLRPGDLTLELPPLRYREGDGRWQVVDWKPIPIKVQTAAIADVKDLRDITSIENLPPDAEGDGWSAWIAPAGGGIALVVLLIAAWRWRQNRPAAGTAPEDRARRDLERIAALKLAETGKGARFHALLHVVVRRYLRRRFGIAARARTSAELRAQVDGSTMSCASRCLIDAFLERCDRAKFAGTASAPAACEEAAELARQIVSGACLKYAGDARKNSNPASAADCEGDGS